MTVLRSEFLYAKYLSFSLAVLEKHNELPQLTGDGAQSFTGEMN